MTSPINRLGAIPPRRAARGFTLIELLLVTAILAIVSLVSVPYLIHSMRGNRLRTAARTIVQSSKYARSMALLKQQTISLTFDLRQPALHVSGGTGAAPVPAAPPATNGPPASTSEEESEPSASDDTQAKSSGQFRQSYAITHVLEGVQIESVEINETKIASSSSATVLYHANGLCDPFTVRLVDSQGSAMVIKVDPLSTATTERSD